MLKFMKQVYAVVKVGRYAPVRRTVSSIFSRPQYRLLIVVKNAPVRKPVRNGTLKTYRWYV